MTPENPAPGSTAASSTAASSTAASSTAASRNVALVFIHGIGMQDRYRPLTEFVRGLMDTSTGDRFLVLDRNQVAGDAAGDLPQGRFIPLRVESRSRSPEMGTVDVDVHEIYWAPLLNDLTTSAGVLRWILVWQWRSLPWNRALQQPTAAPSEQTPEARERQARAARRDWGKWLYQILYIYLGCALVATTLWWLLSSQLLALDQLAHPETPLVAPSSGFRLPATTPPEEVSDFAPPLRDPRALLDRDRLTDLLARFWGEEARRQSTAARFHEQSLRWAFVRRGRLPDEAKRPGLVGSVPHLGEVLRQLDLRDVILGVLRVWSYLGMWLYIKDVIWLFFVLARSHWRDFRVGAVREGAPEERRHFRRMLGLRIAAAAIFFVLAALLALMSKLIVLLFLTPLALFLLLTYYLRMALVYVIGDIEIYCTRNEHSDKYGGREAVLTRTLETLRPILDSERYDEVYIAGHSLGSVIGLDALRRLYMDYALHYADRDPNSPEKRGYEKIKAFITFGSPLEKTQLFFRHDDYKSRFGDFSREVDWRIFHHDGEPSDASHGARGPHRLTWFNFWIWTDIFCDPLSSSFPVSPRHDLRLTGHLNPWPHSDYGRAPAFVRNLLRILSWRVPETLDRLELEAAEPRRLPPFLRLRKLLRQTPPGRRAA